MIRAARLRYFPGLLIGASLKRDDAEVKRRLIPVFPRSIDRGLIEAAWAGLSHDVDSMSFPRSIDRGLIEAMESEA